MRGIKVHRDTFHAGLGAGRYLLGLTWYHTLTGRAIRGGSILLDEPVEESTLQAVRAAARQTVASVEEVN